MNACDNDTSINMELYKLNQLQWNGRIASARRDCSFGHVFASHVRSGFGSECVNGQVGMGQWEVLGIDWCSVKVNEELNV